jgi:hypothetical protein
MGTFSLGLMELENKDDLSPPLAADIKNAPSGTCPHGGTQ